MKGKPTPGWWHPGVNISGGKAWFGVYANSGKELAVLTIPDDPGPSGEGGANSRLMSAGPEMKAALQLAKVALEDGDYQHRIKAWHAVKAALDRTERHTGRDEPKTGLY